MIQETHDLKNAVDLVSAGVAFGTVAQVLPIMAAVASLIWTTIRIAEWLYSKWTTRR